MSTTFELSADDLAIALTHTDVFGRVFLPEYCYHAYEGPAKTLVDTLDNPQISLAAAKRGLIQSRTAIAAPRGIGKTTNCGIVFPARKILSGQANYLIIIGASADVAIEMSENLKTVLFDTQEIQQIFAPEEGKTFNKDVWEVRLGKRVDGSYAHTARVLPLGPGGKIRGRRYGYHRPDLIILDDIENDRNVQSELGRDYLSRWLHGAVLNTVARDRSWQVVYPGTIIRHDSLLSELLDREKSPEWSAVRLSICDADYNSLYPSLMTTEQVREMVEAYRRKGKLSEFSREFMSIPTSPEEQCFREEMFIPYSESTENLSFRRDAVNFVLIDPARTVGEGSCRTAVMGAAVIPKTGTIYVRELEVGKWMPDELFRRAFDMYDRLNASAMGVEVTGLEEHIKQPLLNAATQRPTRRYNFVWTRPRDKKERRPGALLPYYKRGHVRHNPACCSGLEARLLEWPACAAWDELDAFNVIHKVMEEGGIYFENAYAEQEEQTNKTYAELEAEDYATPYSDPVFGFGPSHSVYDWRQY